MLETLSISIEKERPVWGYHHIAGATAEEKINTLWHTFPHEEFLEALFYLADHKTLFFHTQPTDKRGKLMKLEMPYTPPIHFTSYKQGWK